MGQIDWPISHIHLWRIYKAGCGTVVCQKVQQRERSLCDGSQSLLRRECPELKIASNSYKWEDTTWATDSTLSRKSRCLIAHATSHCGASVAKKTLRNQ